MRIYTIGHSNASVDDFVTLLRGGGVEAVVDVRSSPYSQYIPHFNREPLMRFLVEAGFSYHFAGEYLGGRPKDPTCYKLGKVPEGKADYLKLVDYSEVAKRPWFQKGIDRLLQIAQERPTALMCSEEDPYQCHRFHLITRLALEPLGIEVVHIRHKPQEAEPDPTQPQQLSMF
jgi:uncharacterized protein (DUF488 family)